MLKKIRIKNFRSIQDSGEINFIPGITVLVGQNESGKTSILEAINYFGKFFHDEEHSFERDTLNEDLVLQNNEIQTAKFTYSTTKKFHQKLKKLAEKKIHTKSKWIQRNYSFNLKNLENIEEYTVSLCIDYKKSTDTLIKDVDDRTFNFFPKVRKRNYEKGNQAETVKTILTREEVAKLICLSSPRTILFDSKGKLLPDRIKINDLKEKRTRTIGYYAVKNLETQMQTDFYEIAQKNDRQKKSLIDNKVNEISVNFQKVWKQKIHTNNEIKIGFSIERDKDGLEWVQFYVNSKKSHYLPPRKRSAGMIWFLSLWLELMAHKNSEEKLNLLFDEPGNNLHNTACEDVLTIFKELTAKDHQIIFSTHRPNLLTEELQRLRIVVNDEKNGTIVESISKSKIGAQNRRDAFYPIIISMGISPGKEMGILSKNSVILEGISDYFYFEGMRHILKPDSTYKFVPGVGVKYERITTLISFCIGYGINFVVILDKEYFAKQIEETIKKEFPEIIENKIIFLEDKDIEEMFSVKDLKLINPQINIKNRNNNLEVIGTKGKATYAAKFLTLVKNDEINKTNLDPETIKKFELIFSRLEKKFEETK